MIMRFPFIPADRPRRVQRLLCAALVLLAAACGDGGGGGTGVTPNPTPGVTRLDPAGVMQGSGAFTLTVNGSGFVGSSIVRWNGLPRPTTFVSATRITAQIGAEDVEHAGTAEVSVLSPGPGGGVSNAVQIDISSTPPAVLTDLSPDTLMVDVGGTVTITGTGFVAGSHVTLGTGFVAQTTVVSPTEVRFTLQATQVPHGGFAQVSVLTPDNVESNVLPLTLANPAPVVTSSTPTQALVEQDSLVVHLTGTGFVRATRGYVNGNERTTRRMGPTQVDVVLTAADLASTGTRTVSVVNLTPGGGGAGVQLPVVNPLPAVTAVSPAQAPAAQDSLVVRLTGTGFVPATEVRLDGSPRPSRRISPTQVEAVLTADDLSRPGTYDLTAVSPQPGGGASAAASITFTTPAPVLTTLPSNGATAGGGGYTLTVHGSGFVRGSRIRWNGADRTTRYVSNTRLETDVTAADVATPRTVSVSVSTPGGGTSGTESIAVRAPGSATLTSALTLDLPASGIAYDAGRGRVYASLGSGAGARANSVVAVNPGTGAVTASVDLPGDPGTLALSDDGTTLWVALDGTREVVRLSLPGLTPGTRFSLGGNVAAEMRVVPGQAGTVVVSMANTCCSPSHEGVAVWDDGVRRARSTPDHIGPNSIVFGESPSVLYGYDTDTSPTHLYTLRLTGEGVSILRETADVISAGRTTIAYGGGRVYNASGYVADAGRHTFVGYMPEAWAHSSVAVDAELGRAYFVQTSLHGHELRVFDVNTFERLGTASWGGFDSSHDLINARETLLRWGTDGLVVSDGTHIHILHTALAGP
jgi:trimeric autotransporter adhesin